MRLSSKLPHGSVFVFLPPEPADIFREATAAVYRLTDSVGPGSVTVWMIQLRTDEL